ncbi:MAG: MMPL family transporter, partial [Motiliproteus sp.]|nr:MMPL family transporter [Motiliproteus sp.]
LLQGMPLSTAYLHTLKSTGRAVAFTGITLAIGVGTWLLSPIKFQADMGILLTFMFLWNMLGALVLLPALAYFLIRPKVVEPLSVITHSDYQPDADGNKGDSTLSNQELKDAVQ